MSRTAESSPLTGLGAWLWASGSHVCMGTNPTFVPNPTMMSTMAILIMVGSRLSAAAMRAGQSRDDPESITPTVEAYTRVNPARAMVMPTEHRMMYFQAASVDSSLV